MDGKQLRDEALEQVNTWANAQWRIVAYAALVELASTKSEFTADEVGQYVKQNWPAISTHEPRAMGAIIKKGQLNGLIEATDRFINSNVASKHASPSRVWRSLIQEKLI